MLIYNASMLVSLVLNKKSNENEMHAEARHARPISTKAKRERNGPPLFARTRKIPADPPISLAAPSSPRPTAPSAYPRRPRTASHTHTARPRRASAAGRSALRAAAHIQPRSFPGPRPGTARRAHCASPGIRIPDTVRPRLLLLPLLPHRARCQPAASRSVSGR